MRIVERIARSLCAPDEDRWPEWVHHARAAIVALREPSEGMLFAGEYAANRAEDIDDDFGLHETVLQSAFKAMIDEALAESWRS